MYIDKYRHQGCMYGRLWELTYAITYPSQDAEWRKPMVSVSDRRRCAYGTG